MLMAMPVQAKTISGETAARVTEILATCVTAVSESSNAVLQNWRYEEGFVPGVYISYERWIAPEGDFKVIFGQRSDTPGQPYICEAVRVGQNGSFLSIGQEDRRIIEWVKALPETTLSGVTFRRHDGFKSARNAETLSACFSGQMLMLDASATNKGAARFGVGIPLLESLEC